MHTPTKPFHDSRFVKRLSDLNLLTIGMVLDIWTERGNDDYRYSEKDTVRVAGQRDFDNF